MKYSFMLAKLASLMNFIGVIADGAVAARKNGANKNPKRRQH
jgi:hypothetical protein